MGMRRIFAVVVSISLFMTSFSMNLRKINAESASYTATMSVGSGHAFAIADDGSLFAWGCNYEGLAPDTYQSDAHIKLMDNVKSVSVRITQVWH
jgi:alpha-tubulin suppressor-like RCC1 family protein